MGLSTAPWLERGRVGRGRDDAVAGAAGDLSVADTGAAVDPSV